MIQRTAERTQPFRTLSRRPLQLEQPFGAPLQLGRGFDQLVNHHCGFNQPLRTHYEKSSFPASEAQFRRLSVPDHVVSFSRVATMLLVVTYVVRRRGMHLLAQMAGRRSGEMLSH